MSTPVPILDLKAQYESIRAEVDAAIRRVVDTQHFILGPEVEHLEAEIAVYSRVKHAIGVSSGTDAILIALMALGIGVGDEVITTPHTFVATSSSILRLGARPVFVDIDPTTYNLDASHVRDAIGKATKALLPVHLFGQMADTRALGELSREYGLPVVEDAAQALGAEYGGVRAGGAGTLGTYSFFPSKNLGGFGDGGMVVTNDDVLANHVRLLRNQGQSPKYNSVALGGNFRLDALQAAILRAKLPRLDGWNAARARNAARYRELFAQSSVRVAVGPSLDQASEIALPSVGEGRRHVFHHFVIRAKRRDELRAFLATRGIGTEVYYPIPIHLQPAFAHLGYGPRRFPEAERAAAESLAIPIYPELTEQMQARVVEAIVDFYTP